MLSRFRLVALLLAAQGAPLFAAETPISAAQDWKLVPVSAQQKLTALTPGKLEPFAATPALLRGARGEYVNFQFVVTAGQKPIERIEIERTGLADIAANIIAPANLQLFRENYVFVAQPSGNRDLTPKWWPDALLPLELAPKNLAAGQSAVFWGSLLIPKDAASGEYYGELDFKCDAAPRRLALILDVENRALPAPKTRANVALYYDVLRDWYRKNGQNYSDLEWRAQKKRFYDFLLEYGLNAYDLPVDWDDAEAEKYLRDPRVLSVRTPELGAPDFALALQKLRATGTLSKAFYYRFDEPTTPAQFEQIRAATPQLRAIGVRHLVTAHPNEALRDAVDIWCPNIGDFFGINHLSAPQLQSERAKGRETWFYTMVEPKFPLPTWLLDEDSRAIGDFAPLMARYGFSGFVYSMAHGWGPKPLENLTSFAGTSGDGTLIYPAETIGGVGPIPSIRLMLLRDLIETVALQNAAPKADSRQSSPRPAPLKPPAPTLPLKAEIRRQGAPTTEITARLDAKKQQLIVHFRADNLQSGDYVGVELAPADIEKTPEKWRFIATRKGNLRVEKWTREGRHELENSGFIATRRETENAATASATVTEMRIPLAVLAGQNLIRFDALRRTTVNGAKITTYLYSGGGDPALMPLFRAR